MVSPSPAGAARPVRYELLTLGDELLLGLTANGHLSFVGAQLGRRGVLLQRQATVTDEADAIIAESNQGGEMVRAVLAQAGADLPVQLVRAMRGKLGTKDYTELSFPGGHIGIYVSARAREMLPPAIARCNLVAGEPVFETLPTFGEEPLRMVSLPALSHGRLMLVQVAGSLDDAHRVLESATILFGIMAVLLLAFEWAMRRVWRLS